MDGYSANSTDMSTSVPPQQPSLWDAFTEKAQSMHPLSSLLGQAGNDFGQRTINLLHGDGFRTDAQAYPLQPPPPLPLVSANPAAIDGGAMWGSPQAQQTMASVPQAQAPDGGEGGVRGYIHGMADNLGVAPILHGVAHPIQTMTDTQRQIATDQHPFQTALRRATVDNPMSGIAQIRGLAGTAMNSLVETGRAFDDMGITPYGYQTPKYGPNYAGAAVHAVRAIPILGEGLENGMNYAAQNGMGDPGNSYLQDVGKVWSSSRRYPHIDFSSFVVADVVDMCRVGMS